MPNIRSAKKRVKVTEVKTLRNSMIKSAFKTAITKFENSISEQQLSKITEIEKILQPEVRKTINNSQLRIILDILLHRQEEFFPIKYEQQSLQVQFIKLFSLKGDWYVEVINKDTGQKEELYCQSIDFYP